MKPRELPPIEVLRKNFDYNPETGELKWKVKRGRMRAGDTAGHPNKKGYLMVGFEYSVWLVHRICWALYHGVDPYPAVVDHTHGVEKGNAITNLRKVTSSENNYNKVAHSKSGHRGVRRVGNRWRASIVIGGKQLHLGYFGSREEAINARLKAEQEHGIFVR